METRLMNSFATSVFSGKPSGASSVSNITDLRNRYQEPRSIVFERESSWLDCVKKRLEELVDHLPFNWDGYNGKPVSFLNATFALSMLNSICRPNTPPPQIVPGSNGDLQIEWHTLNSDIEILIRGPYSVSAWLCNVGENQNDITLELSRDFTEVARWVEAMSEQQSVANAAAA
jgi:hypothetical protein